MEDWVTAHDSVVNTVQATMSNLDITQNSVKQEPNFEHGDSSTKPPCSSSSPSTVYYSARTESMIKNKDKFSSDLEFNTEHSKIHWSQLASSSTDGIANTDIDNLEDLERLNDNLEHFERLKRDVSRWGGFLSQTDFESLVVNEKIEEGAQAEIYAATLFGCNQCVVKVFKQECALRDLERQWPEGMMKSHITEMPSRKLRNFIYSHSVASYLAHSEDDEDDLAHYEDYEDELMKGYSKLTCLYGGTLLKDERFKNRFAFVMKRQWGDLRKVIDALMLEKQDHGSPFSRNVGRSLMLNIARDMRNLHRRNGIIHRDLKASNVLVPCSHKANGFGSTVTVTDFECSVGVVGTAFWRAPEILQQLKDRVPLSKIRFSYTTDVYSYGMTCYEIVTGRIPFEDHNIRDYDVVLNGARPDLPHDLDPILKELITDCWHPNPLERPYFHDIVNTIKISERKEEEEEEEDEDDDYGSEEHLRACLHLKAWTGAQRHKSYSTWKMRPLSAGYLPPNKGVLSGLWPKV